MKSEKGGAKKSVVFWDGKNISAKVKIQQLIATSIKMCEKIIRAYL